MMLQQPVADSQVDSFRETIKWEELASLSQGRKGDIAILLDGLVYVGGGYDTGTNDDCGESYKLDICMYNLTTNQWSSPITTPYCLFAVTVIDGNLVTVGGRTKSDDSVNKVLVLNAGQWKYYSEMPTARYDATAVGYHSMLLVVGGGIRNKVESKWIVLSITELLDTTNGCWYTCNNLPCIPTSTTKGCHFE